MTEYFHKILDKYNKKLEKFEVKVNNIDDISERELEFNKIKSKIQIEFNKNRKKLFILIKKESTFHKKPLENDGVYLCFNAFTIRYIHNGYSSEARAYLINVLTNELIDVSMNTYMLDTYDKDLKVVDFLLFRSRRVA